MYKIVNNADASIEGTHAHARAIEEKGPLSTLFFGIRRLHAIAAGAPPLTESRLPGQRLPSCFLTKTF